MHTVQCCDVFSYTTLSRRLFPLQTQFGVNVTTSSLMEKLFLYSADGFRQF